MTAEPPLFYLIAGEPSGDMLGAGLMAGLSEKLGGKVRFAGIGGEAMRAQGLDSLFPMSDLTVMGLTEVLPRLPHILQRADQTLAHIQSVGPLAVITIDSWGFCGRIQKAVQKRHPAIKRIHYVAPMVWAWKKGRAKTLARVLDMLMTLLPFEPQWFEKEGLKTVCVGHPVVESAAGKGNGAAFRLRHGIDAQAPILVVLPGSRHSEASRLLPIFEQAVMRLSEHIPSLNAVIPTVEGISGFIHKAVENWPIPVTVTLGLQDKYDGFAAGQAALAASGTVSLELAMAGLPMVIGYRVSPITAFIATKFLGLRVEYASLLNILSAKSVVPEFLQGNCKAALLANALEALFSEGPERTAQIDGLANVVDLLGGAAVKPSIKAAEAIMRETGTGEL